MKHKTEIRNLLIYSLLVLVAYSIPVNTGISLNKRFVFGIRFDYVIHFLLFLPVPFLIRKTLSGNLFGTIVLLALGAALVEGIHLIIPNRSFNPNDALANSSGIVAGIIGTLTIQKMRTTGGTT
jgi:hypothetical protein